MFRVVDTHQSVSDDFRWALITFQIMGIKAFLKSITLIPAAWQFNIIGKKLYLEINVCSDASDFR